MLNILPIRKKKLKRNICIYTHTYIKLNHFAVYPKLTQHCKPTIFQ